MEVNVQSLLQSEAQGRVTVHCDPNDTVDSLISAFCTDTGVRQKRHYVLRTRENDVLPNTARLQTCNVQNGTTLYLTTRDTGDDKLLGCNNWWLLAVVTLLIGTVGLVAISVLMGMGDFVADRYGVVIDAGSTHTEVIVFTWRGNKYNGTGLVEQTTSCRTGEPISAFAHDPSGAGASLRECLDEVVNKALPNSARGATPLYLGATAGMRLLNLSNPLATERILSSVRSTIRDYNFLFSDRNARIISGREEGSYAWVTANYIKGVFGVTMVHHEKVLPAPVAHQEPSFGALDLGGASTQITFEPGPGAGDIPSDYVEPLVMYGRTYRVFTDTFLCYGKQQADLRFLAQLARDKNSTTVKNPCFPAGYNATLSYRELFSSPCTRGPEALKAYGAHVEPPTGVSAESNYTFVGESNSVRCMLEVRKLFNHTVCSYGQQCSWDGHYLTPVSGKFLAFAGFYWVMEAFNFTQPEDRTISAFRNAVAVLCTKSWPQVMVMPVDRPGHVAYTCFDGHYVLSMLTDSGYHFNDTAWEDIQFVHEVDGTNTGWAMGYMLNQTNSLSAAQPQPRIQVPVFISLMIIFSVLLVTSVLFACYARKSGAGLAGYRNLDGYGSV